ncbi:hypothetical protein TVAG_148280 [Trichomonas vaginalis G3]|uniref:Sulfatase N-terminal domain-containing protein n=1 Tax=Trichomonas vaginalis (strain ATCC PRA-98 / G3) TaxID=412133 RepID=A2FFJ6_TRIV3|nr:sulfatase family [Trichomonas vaginalis G3]EAX96326.1 hypothetical protein TVAG_148280 [Trichomonas vaginalis G3]KAI5496371.1 sulfatase family [Trichomonas vaginalis G3]|eukprot:XP_001309256.1 hypothetical protein [Trichomonas vaginalis G3]
MDSMYYSKKNGGGMGYSVIPYLEKLAMDKNNIHFSNKKSPIIGGIQTTERTSFTTGSVFGAMCGVPYLGINQEDQQSEEFFNNLSCISELLMDQNYITSATFGSSMYEWGYGRIFETHHFQRITSLRDMKKGVEGGEYIPDHITWEFFINELNDLSKKDNPFFAFMSTIDTHEPGFSCKLCEKTKIKPDMVKAANCADKQLKKFMEWAKKQEWYQNTVIIIYGDHVSRDWYLNQIANSRGCRKRSVYNVIINSEVKSGKHDERTFTHYDMMPTVLAAAGVKIKGDRLGIGVNLFSSLETNYEKYGKRFTDSFSESVHWYGTEILQRPAICDGFNPCINLDKLELYTNISQEIV